MAEGGYKIRDQNAIHFITFAVVEWIDVFTRSMYADIVFASLNHCQKTKGLNIHAWVIMSNHIHLIISVSSSNTLSSVLRDFKKYTSYEILRTIETNQTESRRTWMLALFKKAGQTNSRNTNYQFWRQDNHPIELDNNAIIEQKINYLHNNPVAANMVQNAEDYVYSSARDYCGSKGLIDIDFLD